MQSSAHMLPTPPKPLLALTIALGAALALSAAFRLFQALTASPTLYFVAGFEAVLLIAALVAILAGVNRFRQGPALAVFCAAGATFALSVLGATSTGGGYRSAISDPFTLARLALAALLALDALAIAVARNPKPATRALVNALLLAAISGALAAPAVVPAARNAITGLHPVATTVIAVVVFLAWVGFLSAAIHQFAHALLLANPDSEEARTASS